MEYYRDKIGKTHKLQRQRKHEISQDAVKCEKMKN